jgi:hypothetical protein
MTSAVTCGATTSPIAQGATFNSGALAAGDATFVRGVGTTSCASSAGTSHFLDVFQFTVSTAGTYVFDGCFPSIDAYGQLYQNAFNPANPCAVPTNFVTANDDSAPLCGSDPRLTASLVPGVTYFLVSTSFSAGGTGTYSSGGQVGRYTKIGNRVYFNINLSWTAHTGTGNIQINGLPFTSLNLNGGFTALAIRSNNYALTASNYMISSVAPNVTSIAISQVPVGGGGVSAVPLDTVASLIISGHYEV